MFLRPDELPWCVFVGVLAQMGMTFRMVVVVQALVEIVGLTDVKASLRVLEDVNEEHDGDSDDGGC